MAEPRENEPDGPTANEPARAAAPRKARRRRWFQFGLRTLLAVTALAAGGAMAWRVYVEPFRHQRQAMLLVEKLHGTYRTRDADSWVRWALGSDSQIVTFIDLADCDTPDAYADQVAQLPALEILVVGGLEIDGDHLRRWQGLKSLRWLVLDSTRVQHGAIEAFQTALPKAKVHLSERRSIRALQPLASLFTQVEAPPGLRDQLEGEAHFELATAAYSFPAGATSAQLTPLEGLRRLDVLSLAGTRVDDAGMAHLAQLRGLRQLALTNTAVTDDGLGPVGRLPNLEGIILTNTAVTDDGLARLGRLDHLKQLWLDGTRVTARGASEFERQLPGCKSHRLTLFHPDAVD